MGSAFAAGNVAMASSRTAGTASALSSAASITSSLARGSCTGARSPAVLNGLASPSSALRQHATHTLAHGLGLATSSQLGPRSPRRQLSLAARLSAKTADVGHVFAGRGESHPAARAGSGGDGHSGLRTLYRDSAECCFLPFWQPSQPVPSPARCHLMPALPYQGKGPQSLACRSPALSPFQAPKVAQGVRACAGDRTDTATAADEAATSSSPSQKTKFTVTTPLYYVNAAPHMGSAYPTIAADALARFQRLQGEEVVFVTGTDEHGEKIALAASANGRSPRDHVDLVAEDYRALWKELAISNDRFIRTTQSEHETIVAEFFQRVWDKGDIYRADYEGLYCVACEEYKDEKELLEDKCCPIHRKPCVERKEDNYFFALSKYQKPLEEVFESNPDFVRPSFRKNEVLGWVGEGLRDFSISRAAVEWGIPVPTDPKQTIYVWFDALLGYLTALLEEGQEPTLANVVAGGHWPASVHIIGKDILRFHAVYWPAMLMSAGLPIPRGVYGHGFLTKDGLKMGKSLGNTIEPKDLVARFGPDAVRYFFLREIEFGRDGDYAEERFINIVNANLANTIGNLLNRTLGLLKKNCEATIPMDTATLPEDHALRTLTADTVARARREYASLQFAGACEAALSLATAGNLYLDERAPWAQFKKGEEEAREAAKDLTVILELVRVVAILLSPITPGVSRKIYLQLGYLEADFDSLRWEHTQWGGLRAGQKMAEPSPVFQRIEDPSVEGSEPAPSKGGKKGGKSKQKAKEEAKTSVPS